VEFLIVQDYKFQFGLDDPGDLYGSSRFDDIHGSSRPDNLDGLDGPYDPNRPDDPDELG